MVAKEDPDHLRLRVIQLVLDDGEAQLWGGEAILCNGLEVGEVRSAGYGHTLGAAVALCHIHTDEALTAEMIREATFSIDLAGEKLSATAWLRPPYDPGSKRPKM